MNDPTALVGCTAFEIDLLLALAYDGPQNGADVLRHLNGTDGEGIGRYGNILSARLYTGLDSLVEKGLVRKDDGTDGRENAYRLTDDGRESVQSYVEYATEEVFKWYSPDEWSLKAEIEG